MNDRIERLERNMRWIKLYASLLTAALLFLFVKDFQSEPDENEILRAKGLIIEDQYAKFSPQSAARAVLRVLEGEKNGTNLAQAV